MIVARGIPFWRTAMRMGFQMCQGPKSLATVVGARTGSGGADRDRYEHSMRMDSLCNAVLHEAGKRSKGTWAAPPLSKGRLGRVALCKGVYSCESPIVA